VKRLLIIVALTAGLCRVSAQTNSIVWVANNLSETLSKIDLATGMVETNALTLGSAPNDLVIEGTTAYVVNSLSNHVQLIDLNTPATISTIEIYQGMNPWAIALYDENRVFVTNFLTGNVSILDLESGQETGSFQVGSSLEGICISDDILFVSDVNFISSSQFGPGFVYAYSLPDLELLDSMEVGINPQVLKLGPEGNLHVVCTGDYNDITGQIDIIDIASMTVQESIPIGGTPWSLAFSSGGIAYLGAGGWEGNGSVLSYDGISYEILRGDLNPIIVPSAAMGLCISQSDHIFISCFPTDEVVEIDSSGNVINSYQVGDGPAVLAVWEPPPAVKPEPGMEITCHLTWNFPNPFNTSTSIGFFVEKPADVNLEVFDVTGRMILIRQLGTLFPGEHRMLFSPPESVGSGILLYRITSEDNSTYGEMLYLK